MMHATRDDEVRTRCLQVAELAAAVRAKPDQLRRVLRLLAALGVFEETSPGGCCISTSTAGL